MGSKTQVPLIIRGQRIEDCPLEFGGRSGDATFMAADVAAHLDRLTLAAPSMMRDLYEISLDEIIEYLKRLGDRLVFERNDHLKRAYDLLCEVSNKPSTMLRYQMSNLPALLQPEVLRDVVRRTVGRDYLEGWVEQPGKGDVDVRTFVRAFGARAVHVIAGNAPKVSVLTIQRNALTRSDAIIKAPSNDPLTATAIASTMIDLDPHHPLTKHVSVGYWKGGDERIETALYDPRRIEKIVAWGGFASIQHVKKYLQPGLDLIALDPKLSGTIIGREAFDSEETLRSVARRLAVDIGGGNQEGCVSARVVYVASGTDAAGLERANRLGQLTFEAIQQFPPHFSTPSPHFDPELKAEIDGVRLGGEDDYRIFGGVSNEGAIIVSQSDVPVEFSRILSCRVANLVPIDNIETAVRSVSAYTQTIGIFPESLKHRLRDQLAFQGAQRLVSLGGAGSLAGSLELQDGIEPIRRMVKWITEEVASSELLETLPRPLEAAV